MCGNGGKWVKDGVFWPKIDFYSDFGVILVQTTKGQLISECLFDVLIFPKNQR